MARESGLSHTTIWRSGARSGCSRISERFKLSIRTSWTGPRHRRICRRRTVDEKSQIQALDRTQPVLPMLPGMPRTRLQAPRHDLAVRSPRCRHRLPSACYTPPGRFSTEGDDRSVPDGLDIHIVMDNSRRRRSRPGWRGGRTHVHFTPTSASWINRRAEEDRSDRHRRCRRPPRRRQSARARKVYSAGSASERRHAGTHSIRAECVFDPSRDTCAVSNAPP